MAPKKEEKGQGAQRNPAFTEVERAMFELQIADLNRKLARLRSAVKDYEERNEKLQNDYNKLDEDRADIIAYLKKTLGVKNEENNELKDSVKALEELREVETAQFKARVTELEKNFTIMKDQLTSENKLLGGKLNTLEEFRAIKDDLMRKFDRQQEEFEAQEMKYKRVIYEAEKKFVIGKDKLKKEMEARLLHLAQDFQDASESRIAASTHRVIRENIALNNQLDNLLFTQAKVAEQNEKFKEDERAARNAMEVAEAERDKAINKSIVQLKVIDQLTAAFQTVKQEKAFNDKRVFDLENLQAKVKRLTKENESMLLQIRILEQNLHASSGEHNKYMVETAKLVRERDTYKKVIKDTTFTIQAALKMDQWAVLDPTREILDRKVVLTNILSVINTHRRAIRAESVESLISFTDVYEKGDLGFVPKPQPTIRSKTSLVSTPSHLSFEEKHISVEASPAVTSAGTLATIPSISVMPQEEEVSIPSRESIPSFTVTSLHSSEPEGEAEAVDSFEALTDVEKQLALSKLEIQKSILKDLAISRTTFHSKSRVEIAETTSKSKLSIIDSKHSLEKYAEVDETVKDEPVEGEKAASEKPEGEQPEGETPEGEPAKEEPPASEQTDAEAKEDDEEKAKKAAKEKAGDEETTEEKKEGD